MLACVLPPLLAGCSGTPTPKAVSESEYNATDSNDRAGSLLGRSDDSVFSFGKDAKKGDANNNGGGALGVNAYLWRGALDTLSFMPLSSADPFGGVIITDWYQPPTGGERFKATAYILGRQLRADAIRISLFRQVQQNGQWIDAPVSQATTTEVENKVLARARELRAQSGS
jgi:hypothetical protein